MTDKPQVLFGPLVGCSSAKGYGAIAEFPLMQSIMSDGQKTEHMEITMMGGNTKEDGIMANQDKERAEFESSYKSKHSMATTIRLASGRYYSTLVESAWQGWQTSAERSAKRIAELEAEVERLKAAGLRSLDWLASYPGGGANACLLQMREAMKGGE